MSNLINFNKLSDKQLEEYNVIKFNSVNEIFQFLFDEDFTKEDIITYLTDKMKEEIVLNNDNVRFQDGTFYYGSDIGELEEDFAREKDETENEL